jgi:hypothetical protein
VEFFSLSLIFDDDDWLVIWAGLDLEWPKFAILLDDWVVEFSSNESFSIEDGVNWVFSSLIFCCITDKSFSISESNVGRSGPVSLIVSDDLNSIVLPNSYTRVGSSEINTDGFTLNFLSFCHYLIFILKLNEFVEFK